MGGDTTLATGIGVTAKRLGWLLLPAIVLAALVLLLAEQASAQFDIRAIVCPILLTLRAIFPFLAGIIDSLLAAFGCGPS